MWAPEYTVGAPAQRRLNTLSRPPDREGRIRSNLDAHISPPAGDRVCMLLSFQRPMRPARGLPRPALLARRTERAVDDSAFGLGLGRSLASPLTTRPQPLRPAE